MLYHTFISCFAILLIYIPHVRTQANATIPEFDDRIVGGILQSIKTRRYQVAVLPRDFVCGGSLISMKWVVSAAHCIYQQNARTTVVRAGSNYWYKGGFVRKVKRLIRRHDYNPNTLNNDISLILVRSPFFKGPRVTAIAMADAIPAAGSKVRVSGYGTTSSGGDLAPYLKSVYLTLFSFAKCQSHYSYELTKKMICAGVVAGGKDSCQGDSGGPLTHNGYLIGVVSWGYGCATKRYPGVYARVPIYKNWIKTMMAKYS